ncbi:MAG TPA: F0F1 ATP synthase subunit B [Gammaproteobacteria bacterium]|nr:F0F1 ATP synthase subunit B [Gammaproteobacteria bacterium]
MNINATLIGQSIAFFVFVWFVMKYVWPPIINALNERKEKIAEGLAAADRGQKEQVLAQERATEVIKQAKAEAAGIISQAEKRRNEIIEDAKTAAVEEGERLKSSAQAEIEQEIQRAKEALRVQVASIAIAGAERIVSKEIDSSVHEKTLDDLVAQI